MAPEQVVGDQSMSTKESDIWSLACIFAEVQHIRA
jgi:serine/threonine protein kinase